MEILYGKLLHLTSPMSYSAQPKSHSLLIHRPLKQMIHLHFAKTLSVRHSISSRRSSAPSRKVLKSERRKSVSKVKEFEKVCRQRLIKPIKVIITPHSLLNLRLIEIPFFSGKIARVAAGRSNAT